MKSYELLVLDLDGTMYRGNEKIEEAPKFVEALQNAGQPYIYLTNNSTKRPEDVANHLATFDIKADTQSIYTTSVITAQYIAGQKRGANVCMIGEEGLESALLEEGLNLMTEIDDVHKCDYVVIGLDRNITYEKLSKAVLAVRAGATFISTNADKALPTEKGLLPGNGSLTAVIETSTGVKPHFIGKPEPFMLTQILKEKQLAPNDVLMIGDNYETDIQAGIRSGVDTAIVYTGFTSKEAMTHYKEKPTYEWDTLDDWVKHIKLSTRKC